jgi:1,4-alpha-glucan branching enzyme
MNKRHNERQQTFCLTAPQAGNVQLVGDFTEWKEHPLHMHRGGQGVWQATVALEPGMHRYRFLVDGEWTDDPECTIRVPNPFGTQDAIRQVA